jgi:4-hydroxy-L-threonine phosphate dehydrogenase PdxA
MSKSGNKVIGITIGDPAGIGPEVTFKALSKAPRNSRFLIVGDPRSLRRFPARSKNVQLYPVYISGAAV